MESSTPPDPRTARLCDLVLRLARGSTGASAHEPPEGDVLDRTIAAVEALTGELAVLRAARVEAEERIQDLTAVMVSLISFDYSKKAVISGANDIYDGIATGLNMLAEELAAKTVSLDEMSAPLIPISAEILVMPLIGTLDGRRTKQIIDTLLQGVNAGQARVAILDVTGLRAIADEGVQGLSRAVRAVRLLGADVVLTGVQPATARLLVERGDDIRAIRTFGTLRDGIAHAMKLR